MPTLVTPNDSKTLRQIVDKSVSAITSHDQQIATLQAKIAQSHASQEKLDNDLNEDAHKTSEQEAQLAELHTRLKQAHTSASLASGTDAEASTLAYVQHLSGEIEAKHLAIETARKGHAKLEASVHKQQYELSQQIDQAEVELKSLRENRTHLEQARKEAHIKLGEALYAEGMQQLSDIRATETEHRSAARECGAELIKQESSLAKRLSEWPTLARKAEKEREATKEPEPSPAAQVANALDHYLTLLEVYGRDIGGTPYIGRGQLPVLFSVPHEFVSRAVSTSGLDHATQQKLEERRSQLKEYVRQVAQLERDSRNGREGWK